MESLTHNVKRYRRIVLKLGTSTLTAGGQTISMPRLVDLAFQVSIMKESGLEVVIVSSGAIASGRERLAFRKLPKDIPAKQMLAAVGQPRLMVLYDQVFSLYHLIAAQVLLTRADLSDRRRYLNSRNTLMALLDQGVIPIVNENDTVATEEIQVGDNDNLSALVSNAIEADLLVILTDQEGLFTADPRQNRDASLVPVVEGNEIPENLWQMAGGTRDVLGTGGMLTKLQAADLARRGGATVVITQGSDLKVIQRIFDGHVEGTLFLPTGTTLDSRKRFLLTSEVGEGKIILDAGAVKALKGGGSLLPVGVLDYFGIFERGDIVSVVSAGGKAIGRGLVNYPSGDIGLIKGIHSNHIESVLGYDFGAEVIHRDNLVLF